MSFQNSATGSSLKTASIFLNATDLPAGSRWKGEIHLGTLQGNETGEQLEFAVLLSCVVEDIEGLLFRTLAHTIHDPELDEAGEVRRNMVRRLFLEVECISDEDISFEDLRVTLYGLSRTTQPPPGITSILTAMPEEVTPIQVKDPDGAMVNSSWTAI